MQNHLYSQPMKNTLLFLLVCLSLTSCDNELDINAAWVETPVVYGFIDAYQDTQYIRIQKTYQNSATMTIREGAQIADSLYFDTLVVRVFGSDGRIDTFHKVPLPKQEGIFQQGNHFVYRRTGFKPGTAGIGKLYRLEILNPKTGKTWVSNATGLVDSARFGTSGNFVSITVPGLSGEMGSASYNMNAGTNSAIYDLFIRFTYLETYTDNSSKVKYVDYVLQKNWPSNGSGSRYYIAVPGQNYIDFLKSVIKNNPAVSSRTYLKTENFACGGTADLAFVTDLSQPSATIVPKNTQYTNIPGALGIFSSLSVHSIRSRETKPDKLAEAIKLLPQFN